MRDGFVSPLRLFPCTIGCFRTTFLRHAPFGMPMCTCMDLLITTLFCRHSAVFCLTAVVVLLTFTGGKTGGLTACPLEGVIFVLSCLIMLAATVFVTYVNSGRGGISRCLVVLRPGEVTSRVICLGGPLPDV